jgi:hypothetical protein
MAKQQPQDDSGEAAPRQLDPDGQLRQNAIQIANQRVRPDASVDELIAEAEKVLAFMNAGGKVAA